MSFRSATQQAQLASFQAFLNAYLFEVDAGLWHQPNARQTNPDLPEFNNTPWLLELLLPHALGRLCISAEYRSLVGRHRFTDQVLHQPYYGAKWQPISLLQSSFLLVQALYDDPLSTSSAQHELLQRMLDSQHRMAQTIEAHRNKPLSRSSNSLPRFIESEQSLTFGHWLHPTPKSRQGMHAWQDEHYSPELAGQFQLHFFAAHPDLISRGQSGAQSANEIIHTLLQGERIDHVPDHFGYLPIHPLQADYLRHQDWFKALITEKRLIDLGQRGVSFTPTSSVRTLYNASLDYMVKVSMPVKITNSMRLNKHHELDAGLLVGKLLNEPRIQMQFPTLRFICDPAYITLSLPDQLESGFEVIFRENPFKEGHSSSDAISIAALVQDSLEPITPSLLAQLIHTQASTLNLSEQEMGFRWFKQYWSVAIEPLIRLYDREGIALEAHQQNSLLALKEGLPKQLYYRDNQGFYLSKQRKEAIQARYPSLAQTPNLFYDDELICQRFSYYLMFNQLSAVINRLGLDQICEEALLVSWIKAQLVRLKETSTGFARPMLTQLIEQNTLPCKANLLTRVQDVDELESDLEQAVYTEVRNPYRSHSVSESRSQTHSAQDLYREIA